MSETTEELDALDALDELIEESIDKAGSFLRESFKMPEHSLAARQIAAHLKGTLNVALATVSARGQPRVTPIGAIFFRGRFYIPTVAHAARRRHIEAQPAVSVTYFEGVDLAIIVHGKATLIREGDPAFDAIDAAYREVAGQSVLQWGEGLYVAVAPERFFTFVRHPKQFPVDEDTQ